MSEAASDAPVRVLDVTMLSDDRYLLKKITFEHRRRDGTSQRVARETDARGNGAVLLLHHAAHVGLGALAGPAPQRVGAEKR